MIQRLRRHGPVLASALLASAITAGAPAIAHGVHAKFAHNADKVDNLHAVKSTATTTQRKGKLVATNPTTGQLPNNIIAKAPDADLLDGFDSLDFLGVNATAADSNLLDGMDSTDFLGATATAADSNKLDGMDSTDFLGATATAADSNLLDGQDSTAFLAAGATAADSDKLDGKDSTVFGNGRVLSSPAVTDANTCDTPNIWNECSAVNIIVPAGKTYTVLLTANGSFYESSAATNNVMFCASARLSTAPAAANCGGTERGLIVQQNDMEAGSATRVVNLTAGTWVISMGVNPSGTFEFTGAFDSAFATSSALLLDEAANL